jgi:hypothetical protein
MPLRPLLRLLLLLVILGGLISLTLQNLTPQITLTFLGMRLVALPLGYLLLGGIAAGLITGLFLLSLLRLASHLTWRQFQSLEAASTFPNIGAGAKTKTAVDARNTDSGNPGNPNTLQEDWQFDSQPQARTGEQTGSTYSYSYNYPKSPGAEVPPESVYDADYRVIRPRHQETYSANANKDGDTSVYDFDPDELDFDFDVEDPPRRRQS